MFTLINYEVCDASIASIHIKGCLDISRDAMRHGGHLSSYGSVEEALLDYIDQEMIDMGYGRWDVHVLPCAR